MTTRYKTMGLLAAIAAIAISIPTAMTAYADEPTPAPAPATETTATYTADVPDPQGPKCDDFKKSLPTTGLQGIFSQSASSAIASIPQLSTFSAAISGGLNPDVNVTAVLDNGPYNVFAPTNAAFEALDPAELEALKTDPAQLTALVYYHMALGLLGPDDIHGKLTTQEGKQITITGKGGDLKFDDTAKVLCGGITADHAKIYIIDSVLSPSGALPANATTTTSGTETTSSAEATSEATSAEATSTESSHSESADAQTTQAEASASETAAA